MRSERHVQPKTAATNGVLCRPSFRISDIWRAPLHDFPIRDELLYQNLPFSSDMHVLELGPGSGFSAFRLARHVKRMTLVDIPENIDHLRRVLKTVPNLRLVGADACAPGLADVVKERFDAAFGLEVFELLPDPGVCLRNLASILKPGGYLLLQFPNYPPPRNPGVTYFNDMGELEALLRAAGFETWSVHSLELRRFAGTLYHYLHEKPLQLYRAFRSNNGQERYLTYDQSWTFQNRDRLEAHKLLLNSGWALLSAAIDLGGDYFECKPVGPDILNKNLLLTAKAASPGTKRVTVAGVRAARYELEPLTSDEVRDWDGLIASYEGAELFHRRAWLDYLAASRGLDIRLWAIRDGGKTQGYFCAGVVRKGPFQVLGSPLKGWGTNCMGPITNGQFDQDAFIDALDTLSKEERFALAELEHPVLDDLALLRHRYEPVAGLTYVVTLAPETPDEMWGALRSTARNRIRKAIKSGLTIEDTDDPRVADEFFDQFSELMKRKGLVPPYARECPRLLFHHLKEADLLFAIRVRDQEGRLLATGLFPHDERTMYFWGGASTPDGLEHCPNDLMHWRAMELAAARGLRSYNMCGEGRFKAKFGGNLVALKRWQKCYWRSARLAQKGYELYFQKRLSVQGWLQRAAS